MTWITEVDARRLPVTPDLLAVAMPNCPDLQAWATELSRALVWADIQEPHDVAMFLAQVGHESADLTRLEESLWYSADRVRQVWPSRFPTRESALHVAGNPEALALAVYSGRMGNGPASTGDAWRYIGRGPIMLTGLDNYRRCQRATLLPLVSRPERLATHPEYGAMAAAWYWRDRVTLGAGIETVTRQVNGGTHGIEDRQARFDRIRQWQEGGAS